MKMEMVKRIGFLSFTLTLSVLLTLLAVSCVGPVRLEEMDAASMAIKTAKEAGADEWAAAELEDAQDFLSKAQWALSDRKYDEARTLALRAKERADIARAKAEHFKAQAKEEEMRRALAKKVQEAERAIAAAQAIIQKAEEALTRAEAIAREAKGAAERAAVAEKEVKASAAIVKGAIKEAKVAAPKETIVREVLVRAHPLLDVFFDTDKAVLRDDARRALEKNAEWLRDNPKVKIIIEGHADERASNEYNLALGERRAQLVKDYLVGLGVSPERLTTISYGEERPFVLGHNEASWWQNRRVHFVVQGD